MSFDIKIIIGVSTGFIAYIILFLGKGIQKYAIEGFKDRGKVNVRDKSIILAALISYIALNEIITILQIVGFVIIVFGIIFLTAFMSETKK